MMNVTHWDRKKIRLARAQAVPQIGQRGILREGISGLHEVSVYCLKTSLCDDIQVMYSI